MDYSKYVQYSKIIRKDILNMLHLAGSGHPGGSLSSVELIVALYFGILRHDPQNPFWEDRDRVIFSKGHVCPTQYACLMRSGYFQEDELSTLRKVNSRLQGHPSYGHLPGIEVATGSLGQGLSIGNGMAIGIKLNNRDSKVFVLLGDGELQAGQVWEAALTAAHHKLNNVCAIVDYNKLQIDGKVADIKNIYPIKEKFESFGWNALEINGHKYQEIFDAYDNFCNQENKPTVIVAHTIKGKGISYMENNVDWHGKAPNKDDLIKAIEEIDNKDIGI